MIIHGTKHPLSYYIVKAETSKRIFDGVTKALSLVNSYLIITSLSVFSFGLYQLVLSFIAIARGFTVKIFDGLISIEMRRYFNVQKIDFAKRLFLGSASFKLIGAGLLTALIFFGSDIVAGWYGRDISTTIRWASLLLFIGAVQSLAIIFAESVISFSYQAVPAIKEAVKLLLILIVALIFEFSFLNIVIITVVTEAIATALYFAFFFLGAYRKIFGRIKPVTENLMLGLVKEHGLRTLFIFGMKEVLTDTIPWIIKFFINTEAVALYSLSLNLVNFIQDLMPLSGLKAILPLKADEPKVLRFVFVRSIKYTLWMGVALLGLSLLFIPIAIRFIFPSYAPAVPVFLVMALALPIYGVVKVVNKTLGALREYRVLAMRLVNELVILIVGSAILLPLVGIVGIGIVYFLRLAERLIYLYLKLFQKYPVLRLRFRDVFSWDSIDVDFVKKSWRQFTRLSFLRNF